MKISKDIFFRDPPFQGMERQPLKRLIWEIIFNPGYRAVVYYRLSQKIKKSTSLPCSLKNILSLLIIIRLCRVPGVEFRNQSEIKDGLHLPHPHDIVVGKWAKIGKNVRIYNGVTLGAKRLSVEDTDTMPEDRYPIIDDQVVIFSGAKILGPIKIGKNSVVGANAVVLDSFPENSRIVGAPAILIEKKV